MQEKPSRALEVNIAEYRVDVTIDPKYHVIQDVMSRYEGLTKPLNTFLEELCHPRRNWKFIVNKARTFSLGYFYDLKTHPRGPDAVKLYVEIAVEAIRNARDPEVKYAAFSNLFLLMQKFIKESGPEMERFHPVITFGFNEIKKLPEECFSLITKSYYQINRLNDSYLKLAKQETDFSAAYDLLIRFFEYTYSYWLSENDPMEWFEHEIAEPLPGAISALFKPITHSHMKECYKRLHEVMSENVSTSRDTIAKLLALPGFGDIVDRYSRLPEKIYDTVEGEKLKHRCKLVFLFHTMNIPGLSNIHEETLREINRTIAWLIDHEDIEHIKSLIDTTFNILNKSVDKFPNMVLKSVLNMGKGVYQTDKSDLVHFFNEHVISLGFQSPEFKGIGNDWQIQSNLAHIQNIQTWMELAGLRPKWSVSLLSSLIINISLSGLLIKDTDLFPRDITGFLNSDIQPVYNLVKQLMRLFPSYFHEIGAEGKLRDISTKIDEIRSRKDVLVHFLRKQSHVESSNRIISLIESTLDFWRTKSKEVLEPFLPPEIYDQIETRGTYIDGVNRIVNYIYETRGLSRLSDLLFIDEGYMRKVAAHLPDENRLDIERVSLAISFYKLLNQKYCVIDSEIDSYIAQVESTIPMNFKGLREALSMTDSSKKISFLLEVLLQLKEIILSPERFEVREDIYRKRHIAADIPSMYGSYHEAKFDALGLTFRIESIVNPLFEELVEDIDLDFITHHTFYQIYEYLKLFNQALNIDGIPASEFENHLELLKNALKIKQVTFTQYLDIFRGFTQVVQNIVSDYFNSIHEQNLLDIPDYLPKDKLLPKYRSESEDLKELFHKVSEVFLRDIIASSLGIQKLDLFLTRISNTLHEQAGRLPVDKHYMLLTYDPRNITISITDPDIRLLDIVHLGNKGLNMIKMKYLDLPVPPGFIVTTEVFRCRELIESYPQANTSFKKQITRNISYIERTTAKKFGSPEHPLLVSVRSGSVISQPGMMDSYLNVGINEEIVNGIIYQTGDAWFAWDCYRRFLQSYGMSFGLIRDKFDAIIDEFKERYSVPLKKDFPPQQMKEVALAYRDCILDNRIYLAESPGEQLYIAIQRVLNSWNSSKARTYRKIIGISDDWGTAVTVQAMVFGNLSQQSGSGVLFTHSPKFSPDILRPWGDYTIGNQGEDVVSGLVTTYPISRFQAKLENRPVEFSLETRFPVIFKSLRNISRIMVYENKWAPQDIEFTFEGPQEKDLYILQTRNMEMRERKRFPSFVSTSDMSERFIGHGIGVSGGALSGRVVFSLDDISRWRETERETPLILIRSDTVPDDIKEISASEGLLTARGGATSHASIVANRLEKTCVVGCRDLVCLEKEKNFTLNRRVFSEGDYISIEGSEGSIYTGKMEVTVIR